MNHHEGNIAALSDRNGIPWSEAAKLYWRSREVGHGAAQQERKADHEELARRSLDLRTAPPGHAAFREPTLPASEWRAAYFVLARIAQKQLDECRAALAAAPVLDEPQPYVPDALAREAGRRLARLSGHRPAAPVLDEPDARKFARWFLAQPLTRRLAWLRESIPVDQLALALTTHPQYEPTPVSTAQEPEG